MESLPTWRILMALISTLLIYAAAALGEIAGCFAFWVWLRHERSSAWIVPGLLSLAAFAWLLTRSDADLAGRAYAAYGGVYIAMSLGWLWIVEGIRPDRSDWIGALVCLCGAVIILFGRRIA
jgi:small multidrug resistance family-3 protein